MVIKSGSIVAECYRLWCSWTLLMAAVLALGGGERGCAVEAADLGGSPIAIGAGPRALGMGGAFSAIADDATANTWNPAGMTQLERLEAAASGSFSANRLTQSDGVRDDENAFAADSASLVLPFFAFGCQQTVAIGWQREFDFTRRLDVDQTIAQQHAVISAFGASSSSLRQSGSFASSSLSYAVEVSPGFSLGATEKLWSNRWSGQGAYHQDSSFTSVTTLTSLNMPSITSSESILGSTNVTVENGVSTEIGSFLQASPDITIALVYKPRYTLRLCDASHTTTWVSESIGNVPLGPTHSQAEDSSTSFVTYPTCITAGVALRRDDEQTVAIDVTWTHWCEYASRGQNGVNSPISPFLSPADFHDGYSVRLGYEHLIIGDEWVAVARCGVLYEGLPGASQVDSVADADLTHTTVDRYVGATAGASVCLRHVLVDLGAQVRYGHGVGAGLYASPDQVVDLMTIIVRAGASYQF